MQLGKAIRDKLKSHLIVATLSVTFALPATAKDFLKSPSGSQVKPVVGVYPGKHKPGNTFKDCDECSEMVVVPAGSFRMGDLNGGGRSHERPVHKVTISKPFAVGIFEVTQAQWKAVMGSNPSRFKGDSKPVGGVSWNDVQNYLQKQNSQLGLIGRPDRYRLLSEAEWEYVARSGTMTKYHFGNTISKARARYNGSNSMVQAYKGGTVSVGSYPPNAFGLHDIHGNVWEWVEDCWNPSYKGAPVNGAAWLSGNCHDRVLRGGSWFDLPGYVRAAYRNWFVVVNRSGIFGFRVAKTLLR